MDGAPIQPCHRRAPRHPVPQVPERAFIVTRARDGKHFFVQTWCVGDWSEYEEKKDFL